MQLPSHYMRLALNEAAEAAAQNEVPIGAVIVLNGSVIGRGHNKVERHNDATLHAEILALREATKTLGTWRLNGAELYVTLEPCPMCAGALLLSRISKVYFGCFDPRQGAMGSAFDISRHPNLPHKVEVYSGVLEEECREVLRGFFEGLR